MYGDDYGYANSRLTGTIVRRGKHPVTVLGVNNDGTVVAQTVITKKDRICKLTDLNLASPELGMVNTPNGAVYMARKPMRRDWRQGVRRSSVTILSGNVAEITDKLIYRAIRGRFPSLEDAIEDTMVGDISVAFHRHWSVKYDARRRVVKLIYKWYGIAGTIDPETLEVNLQDSDTYLFTHLNQALGEVIND